MKPRCFGLVLMLGLVVTMSQAQPYYRTLKLPDGRSLEYALLLPPDFRTATPYPTLLALPPGPQDRDMVEAGLYYWRDLPGRGWVVISPAAPGPLFFQGAEQHIPALLETVAKEVAFEDGKVHVAGVSNGGRSAFRIALDDPGRVHSLTALPGFPPSDEDYARLERLVGIPVTLYAGEFDRAWVEQMLLTQRALEALGVAVTATVVAGEGHVIESLSPQTLYELLESFR